MSKPFAGRHLATTAYHRELSAWLQEREPGLWRWFASEEYDAKRRERLELELLRNTYRLPRESHAGVYALGDAVARGLGITVPLTLYQGPDSGVMNASLFFDPEQIQVVLVGPVLRKLSEPELRALLGHELAHHCLWTAEGGALRVVDGLLEHVVRDRRADEAFRQTARRQRLWTELYADRGSLLACEDLEVAVTCLVKVGTGLEKVDVAAYLEQAEEVIARSQEPSAGESHPESFLRALALRRWAANGDAVDDELRRLVAGPRVLPQLDLLEQSLTTGETRSLLRQLLADRWFRSEANLALARQYFPDYGAAEPPQETAHSVPEGLEEYFSYVLLDFATSDASLEEAGLAQAWEVAKQWGLSEPFEKVARKELRLTVKAFGEFRERAPSLRAQAAAQ